MGNRWVCSVFVQAGICRLSSLSLSLPIECLYRGGRTRGDESGVVGSSLRATGLVGVVEKGRGGIGCCSRVPNRLWWAG